MRPYVTYADVLAICPYVDQLAPGEDEFSGQRLAARAWLDAAIRAATHLQHFTVHIDDRIRRVCAYKAASEILASQITPMVEANAYGTMAAKFQRMAESEISTLIVCLADEADTIQRVNLGVTKRGYHC